MTKDLGTISISRFDSASHFDTLLHQRKAALACAIAATAPDTSAWQWPEGRRGAGHGVDPIELVADTWAFDAADVKAEAERAWDPAHEGIMVKQPNGTYARAR